MLWKTYFACKEVTSTNPSSRMSGNERCSDIMSLANWLKALFCQPLSYFVLFSDDSLSLLITTASPFSPVYSRMHHSHLSYSTTNILLLLSFFGSGTDRILLLNIILVGRHSSRKPKALSFQIGEGLNLERLLIN